MTRIQSPATVASVFSRYGRDLTELNGALEYHLEAADWARRHGWDSFVTGYIDEAAAIARAMNVLRRAPIETTAQEVA